MDTNTDQNYESGSDYILEYGELCFCFNEEDFGERVEEAARRLGFIEADLSDDELTDLLCLVVNGEICEPASMLGDYVITNWQMLVGPSDRSLVHWLRKLIFRGAWLDQRVKTGELDVVFDEQKQNFTYVHNGDRTELVEIEPANSWSNLAYKRLN